MTCEVMVSRSERPHEWAMSDFAKPHRFIDVGHSKLAAWSFGRGPDVVLVHGWPLSAATWRHVVDTLKNDFTCHLVDLPGAGHTETTDASPIELRAHEGTLRTAIDAMGLSRYALVGHDSGGFVARRVAAKDPRVTGLVLGNTEIPGHTPPLLVAYMLLARSGLGAQLLRPILSSRWARHSPLGFGGCFEDPRFADGEFHDLFVRPLIESPRAMAGAMALLRNADHRTLAGLEGVHRDIRVPVQLVWGTDDPWFPLAKARVMAHQFGGPTEVVEIPGGKLFVHEERAETFGRHARRFLLDCFDAAETAPAVAAA
jgi:haloalkane dehalogenase